MTRTYVNPAAQAERVYPISTWASSDNATVGAASSGTAVITFTPAGTQAGSTQQGSPHIGGVFWSYVGLAVTGGLNISDSSGTLFNQDFNSGSGQNFGFVDFDPPISSQIPTSAMTITLSGAGTTNSTAKLTVQGWFEL